MNSKDLSDLFASASTNNLTTGIPSVNTLKRLVKNSDFILYGAGQTGALIAEKIKEIGIVPKAFADDTPGKQSTDVLNIKIYSLQNIKALFGNDVPLIVTIFQPSVSFLTIKERLAQEGFSNVFSLLDIFYCYPAIFLPYYQFGDLAELVQQQNKLLEAYSLFDEPESREIFMSNLQFRLTLQYEILSKADNEQYFPEDIYKDMHTSNCNYIDCGAYDGDTIKQFLAKNVTINKILAFEPDQENYRRAIQFVSSLSDEVSDKIYIYQFGISSDHAYKKFTSSGNMGSALDDQGNIIIQVISLDDAAFTRLTENTGTVYIKFDIEGEEVQGLKGAGKIIKGISPNLAVSVYHKPDDLWKIPLLINDMNPEYNFYLRQHGEDGMDLVLYTQPKNKT